MEQSPNKVIIWFDRVYRTYARFLTWLAILAGLVTFGMMWLVDINTLMRRVFNSPIPGTLEITESLLTVLVFFAIAFTQLRRGHIRVVLLTRHAPPTAQRLLHALALLAGCAFFAWAAWATLEAFLESFAIREQEWGTIRFPIYPVKFIVFLGVLLLSIQFLLDACREALIATGKMRDAGEHADS